MLIRDLAYRRGLTGSTFATQDELRRAGYDNAYRAGAGTAAAAARDATVMSMLAFNRDNPIYRAAGRHYVMAFAEHFL